MKSSDKLARELRNLEGKSADWPLASAGEKPFDVTVVGLGYVGLPILLMLGASGFRAAGFDIDRAKMERFARGDCPINEPAVREIFHSVTTTRDVSFVDALGPSDVFLIAVPTGLRSGRKTADLGPLRAACASIVPHLRPGNLVILNSTCPPTTCRRLMAPVIAGSGLEVGKDVHLAYCPERLFPGNIAYELVHNEHIIGGYTPACAEKAAEVYRRFVKGALIVTDDLTAEFCKLVENTYRDVNIALANELGMVAERLGIDMVEAADIANRHPRVNVLKPGIGVGGHCLPIDPWFIAEMAPEESILIPTARRINDGIPARIAEKIRRAVAGRRDSVIGCYGLTYKADVNDARESPASTIVEMLERDGYTVKVYDPVLGIGGFDGLRHFAGEVDLLVALVEHEEFRQAVAAKAEYVSGPSVMRF